MDHALDIYFRWFELEYQHSPPAILQLAKGGFCHAHAQRLGAFGKEVSILYSYITSIRRKSLEKALSTLKARTDVQETSLLGKWFNPEAAQGERQPLQPTTQCPVCEAEENARWVCVSEMRQYLAAAANQSRYQTNPLLCWQHMVDVMTDTPQEIAVFLAECHLQQLTRWEEDFAAYFHKTDYRYAKDPKGPEQDAWRKALRFFFRAES
jgi:hypothetical protein